ncbi:MAG: cysteine synthase A [Vampirovibrio sp.]|jgi:cysteine synthase A|nr:cysteine synthase A [Vampirovibrio sp.]
MSNATIQTDISATIGNTPLVFLNDMTEGLSARVALKLESRLPGGSVKDRIAYNMLATAEKAGLIQAGKTTLIEPTSGNTGIALAMLAALKGYKLILVMPDSMSLERRALLLAYGAEVRLTPASAGMKGAVHYAKTLAKNIPDSFELQQFENPANPVIHYQTTGPEIWQASQGKVDAFISSVGTGGTIMGVGRYLREQNPTVELIAVEPAESPVLSGGQPAPHKIQGIGAGFIPAIVDTSLFSRIETVSSEEALAMSRRLAREEGVLSGISSGANVAVALRLAANPAYAGKVIVTVQCSGGERYLSSALFSPLLEEAKTLPVTVF